MIHYKSNTGGSEVVDFETAILDGFAKDGGLYVPTQLPTISSEQLSSWSSLNYVDLAFEILSLFIDRSVMSESELKHLLQNAYLTFEKEEIIPIYKMKSRSETYVLELFHGPTLSFKDIGLAFLVNLVNFFLERKNEKLSIIVATTGDTGPAAAFYAVNKTALNAWILYPKDRITKEQERQITTIDALNVHPVAVANCPDGGDDLDLVITKLFANKSFKEKMKLSSVNSINWGRIMMQTVHYFYAYFKIADSVGEKINFSVPSGAFGNLCAGALAREMGLPVETFVCANNENACLHRIFDQGLFLKKEIQETPSSAIDILIPYNFWRFLYFTTGRDQDKIKAWMQDFKDNGALQFDPITRQEISMGIISESISDQLTLETIKRVFEEENYLLDPHGAVAVAASTKLESKLNKNKLVCLATAHPSKFSNVILKALQPLDELPKKAIHPSIEIAKRRCEKLRICEYIHLEEAIKYAMLSQMEKSDSKY